MKYTFMQNAFMAAVLTSVICGIIGTIIVEKKMVMMSGGIAHASFGGIGLGYYIGIEPMLGGLLFALLSAFGLITIKEKVGTKADTLVAIFWSVGMALGILFISLTPGYPPDMTSYLFGDILTVLRKDLLMTGFLTVIIICIISGYFTSWQAYLFDEEFLAVRGLPVKFMEHVLYILVSISIIVVVKVVGIVLIIALLTIPTSISKSYTNSLKGQMLLAIGIGIFICVTGLIISYYVEVASGATIILLGSFLYMVHYFLKVK